MSDFEWHTEDDNDWDDQPKPVTQKSRRRWLIPLLILALLGTAGFTVYRQVQEVVEATTQTTEQQIRGAFTTLYLASADNDIELFNSLISGRDRDWATQQQQQFADSTLLDRSSLGFTLLDAQPTINDITIDADLQGATVVANARYAVLGNDGLTETISLAIPSIFRRGNNQWLFAPPLPDFWGEIKTQPLQNLVLTYPERDAEMMERIGRDLDQILTTLCSFNDQSPCAAPLYAVDFMTDTAAITLPNPLPLGWFANEPTPTYRLPTPSLVGIPQDQIGYDALLGGYARHIFTPIISQMTGYRCCEQQAYMDALVRVQLRTAGVMGWALAAEDYADIISTHGEVNDAFWIDPPDDAITALIEFLFTAYKFHSADFVAQLRRTGSCNCPIDYLNEFTLDENGDRHTLAARQSQAFRQFLAVRSGFTQTVPPQPKADVVLACQYDELQSQLLRLRLDDQSYETLEIFSNPFISVVPQVHAETVWVELGGGDTPPSIYKDGHLLAQSTQAQAFPYPRPNSAETFITTQLPDSGNFVFGLTDTRNCTGDCPTTILDGLPIWSPDGTHALVYRFPDNGDDQTVELHSSDGLIREVDSGNRYNSHFWIDNKRFVVADNLDLFVQSISDPAIEQWFTPEDFFPFLGEDALNATLTGDTPFHAQVIGNTLFLEVSIPRTGRSDSYLIAIDVPTRDMRLIRNVLDDGFDSINPFSNSPYITLIKSQEAGRATVRFYHAERDTVFDTVASERFSPFFGAWLDGWVLLVEQSFGRLVHPATQTVEYFFPPVACNSGAWYGGE